MSKKAIYAGTFDPFTLGHLDIVKRAELLFDEVIVLLGQSPTKKAMIPSEQRLEDLNKLFASSKNIKVDSWDGLLVDYAKSKSIKYIIRGLRPIGDFDNEFQMATMNQQMHPDLETVFLMTSKDYFYLSSSLVKEIYGHGGDIKKFIPQVILDRLEKMKD